MSSFATFLIWLFAGLRSRRAISQVDREIDEKHRAIAENEKGIEAVKPVVEEAIRRTDDSYYQLRTEIKRAERRIEKTDLGLLERAIRSLEPTTRPSGEGFLRDLGYRSDRRDRDE